MNDIPAPPGPYRFEHRLGAGGMGEVYLAYDQRLGRHVAVKHLRPDRDSPERRARLRREARAVARLNHPVVVQVFDLLETADGDWIVMEYVDGPRLADLLREGPLELERALAYGRDIAEGLAEVHAKGIVHRDLKAENVLIAPSGRPKILDFGLVRELVPEPGEDIISAAGSVLGTPRVLAPEQARGVVVGPRADLFAFGVLLYEMLAGHSPFHARTREETLLRILSEPPEPLPPAIPAELRRLIEQLLEKAPELRPRGAADVARRLERLSSNTVMDDATSEMTATELTEAAAIESGPTGRVRPRMRPLIGWVAVGTLVAVGWGVGLSGFRAPEPLPPVTFQPRTATMALDQDGVEALFEEGWEALRRFSVRGNVDRAIEVFLRLVEHDPSSARAHAGLARANLRKYLQDSYDGMWLQQAEAVARHAVELDDDLAQAHLSLGLVLIWTAHYEHALDAFEKARLLAPENADVYRGLGELFDTRGDFEQAEAAYHRALELRSDDRRLHDLLGSLYFKHGRLAQAEARFRRSMELAPEIAIGGRNLSSVLIVQARFAEASDLLAEVLADHPDEPSLYINQGTALFYQGLYPQAAAAFEKALELPVGANFFQTWANLGDAYRQIPHRRAEARKAYEEAIRLLLPRLESKPDSTTLRSQLVLYHAKAGQRDTALSEMKRLEATDGRGLFRLMVAYEVLGERPWALKTLEQALDAGFPLSELELEPELLALRADPVYHRLVNGTISARTTSP